MNTVAHGVASIVLRRPLWTLLLALLLTLASAWITARGLAFDTSFAALLPEDSPELLEVRELQKMAGGTVELVVAVQGGDPDKRLSFGRSLVKSLRQNPLVQRADVEFPVEFFEQRRLLLLSQERLETLRHRIDEEIQRARARANPLYVDLEEDGPSPWAAVEDIESGDSKQDLPQRVYTSADGASLYVRVKPKGNCSDMSTGATVLASIQTTVDKQLAGAAGLSVRYAGGLAVNQEQNQQMGQDLSRAAMVALVGILLLLTLHIRRLAAPLVLVVPLLMGVTFTLAYTTLVVGQLNLVSGFLVSAILGLGIDFEVHLYLRYLELLHTHPDRRQAMTRAMVSTLPPCVTAAATTSAAFLAMCISDFRGFREYGLIVGVGVPITLVVTYLTLPPLATLISRRARVPRDLTRGATGPSRRLAWGMVMVSGLAVLLSVAGPGRAVRWYNDFYALRGISAVAEFSEEVAETLGGSLSPAAFLVRNLEQARQVEALLQPLTEDPSSRVRNSLSLASMVPGEVTKKEAVLAKIRAALTEVAAEDLSAEDRSQVQEALALARARPWKVDDIPEVYRRHFQTVTGQGQFVVVWPRSKLLVDHDIIAWGRELTRIRAALHASGIPVKIMDENRLAATVLHRMRKDAPMVVLTAALAVLLLLALDLRSPRRVMLVASTLAVGGAWMYGLMAVVGIDVNVFNLAVIPSIFGLGIDNAVHIEHRYQQEGRGSLARVVASTGSAAFLASATTAIGFGAAIGAHHLGIRSLGWLTLLGLCCSFVASSIFFPSLLRVLETRRRTTPAKVSKPALALPGRHGPR